MRSNASIMQNRRQAGFTLLEMAVVLVIIGLLTAGILVGQTLIRQTRINSVMADVQRYEAAVKNFSSKYGALPGDIGNATTYWGAMSICPPSNGMASPGGTLTCNGNNNGTVDNNYELYLLWQHLANAQLISGSYTGIPSSVGSGGNTIGVNVPAGRLPGLGFELQYYGTMVGNWAIFDGVYNHTFVLGTTGSDGNLAAPILTTSEAQSFDDKYDDGLPATGNVRTMKGNYFISSYTSPYCATTAVASTAAYNMAVTGNQCILLLITGF